MTRRLITVFAIAAGLWPGLPAARATPLLVDGSIVLSSEFSIGRLDSLVGVDPGRFGSRGILSPSWVSDSGDHAVQTLVINTATAAVSARWNSGTSSVLAATTVTARHSPDGFDGSAVDVVPETLGVGFGYEQPSLRMPVVSTWFGRFRLSDPSQHLLQELVDGASVVLRWESVSASLGGGLTSLVSKYAYGIRMDDVDRVYAVDDPVDGPIATPYLAPARRVVVATLDAGFPADRAGPLEHAAGVFGVYADDLAMIGGDRAYLGAVARGRLVAVAYDASVAVSLGDGGVLAAAGVRYPNDPGSVPAVTVAARYASGGRVVGRFVPVTAAPQGVVLSLPLENLLVVRVGAESAGLPGNRSPGGADRIRLGLSISGFALPAAEAAAEAGLSAGWIGAEASGSVVFDILSDLSIDSTAGVAITATALIPHVRIRGRLTL